MDAHLEDRIFSLSIVTSILVHVVIVASFFFLNVHNARKPFKNVEVIYQAAAALPPQGMSARGKDVRSVRDEKPGLPPKLLRQDESLPASLLQSAGKDPAGLRLEKRHLARVSAPEGKRHISVPFLKSEKISNPKYANYQNSIRNKIRNRAYLYVEHPEFRTGEVYLTFVIASDGSLRDMKIIDDKTRANNYLRGVVVRSMKEASPFPPFPQDLNYPELSFNVVISFEVEP